MAFTTDVAYTSDMADRSAGHETSVGMPWQAARMLAATMPAPLGAEQVRLSTASIGQVLARPIRAAIPAPAFDTAAMDGYAVAGAGPWRVVGRVLAGHAPEALVLRAGCAVEIATGAIVPGGTEAVLRSERCRREGDTVHHEPGEHDDRDHIRRRGEDAEPGDELVPAGRPASAAVLGAAAQAAVDDLWVHPRPSVLLLVTGDEVIASGTPAIGQIRDAVSPLVEALTTRAGGDLAGHRLLGDDADVLRTEITTADADLVVVSGSSSVGVADHLRTVLTGLGARWYVDGVACRPGHPQALAQLTDGRWLVGLPGNPLAALVAGLTVLEPAVAALAGRTPATPVRLPTLGQVQPDAHRSRIVPVHVDEGCARIAQGARPASLRVAAGADALAVLEPGWTSGTATELLQLP
jgi:molybdopterin molybdotransferase